MLKSNNQLIAYIGGVLFLAHLINPIHAESGLPADSCCFPDLTCADDVELGLCIDSGGIYNPINTCDVPDLCPTEACQADCNSFTDLNNPTDSGDCSNGLPCTRYFDGRFCNQTPANINCENNPGEMGTAPLGGDWWFAYKTGPDEHGDLTISTCESSDFDSIVAVYQTGTECICPDVLSNPTACGDDTCGIEDGGSTVTVQACADTCYVIRVGGKNGATGTGNINLSLDPGPVCLNALPLLADDRFDVEGNIKPCTTDADCKLGETGPDPQTFCRDSDGDGIDDACYVTRNRYLSVKIPQDPTNLQTAIRISLETTTAGTVPLGYVATPTTISVEGPGPNEFLRARISDDPEYLDWDEIDDKTGGYMSISDCEVAPGNTYLLQTIVAGDDIDNEANFSAPLRLPTPSRYCDVTGGGNPGNPPNGAPATLVDMFAIIKGFQGTQVEPKDWLDIEPVSGTAQANLIVNLADVFECVLAFQTNPYPGPVPVDCP